MKKVCKYLILLFVGVFCFSLNVNALSSTAYVDIETGKISVDGKNYNNITKYESLDAFLVDYKADKLPEIYWTTFLFDGVSSVKSPDLDDFIENDSNDTKIKTLEINVLNINTTGNIELTGSNVGMMVAINTNDIKGDINIILNNVSIDTDTKKAPAIYIYNRNITYTDCKVTIKTKANTKNYIEGGKFKKVSLMPSDDLENYNSYYKDEALTNYENFSSYYGIYTKEELKNILFATVTTDSEGLQDGDPYVFYKGSGAISSDIDLYFEGEGFLQVSSKNKEGIETKGNLIFSGSTGDYEIYAYDDCLNTTTSNSAGNNVRNNLVIDVNSLLAVVNDDGDEGDAIDSNGTLTINGGTIYAFAHSNSGDAGLDSSEGTYINGDTIIATGNMTDMIDSSSKQNYIYVRFNSKIEAGTLLAIKDQDDKLIMAFETDKTISTLFYSTEDLNYESFKIYSGGNIIGEKVNGLYTKVTQYDNGSELGYSEVNSLKEFNRVSEKSNQFILRLLIIEVISLIIVIGYALISNKNKKIS